MIINAPSPWTVHYENNSGSLCSVENNVVYIVGKYSTEH